MSEPATTEKWDSDRWAIENRPTPAGSAFHPSVADGLSQMSDAPIRWAPARSATVGDPTDAMLRLRRQAHSRRSLSHQLLAMLVQRAMLIDIGR